MIGSIEWVQKIGMRTAFARYGDTFGTKVSGADWDLNDIYDLIKIVESINYRE